MGANVKNVFYIVEYWSSQQMGGSVQIDLFLDFFWGFDYIANTLKIFDEEKHNIPPKCSLCYVPTSIGGGA